MNATAAETPTVNSLYLYKGATYGGGGGGNNNEGGSGGGYGSGGDGGGNGPRKGLRREPREILPTEKGGTPLEAFNAKGSISGGDKGTPRYLARLRRIMRCKMRGGLPTARKWGPRADREGGRPREKGPAGGIIN